MRHSIPLAPFRCYQRRISDFAQTVTKCRDYHTGSWIVIQLFCVCIRFLPSLWGELWFHWTFAFEYNYSFFTFRANVVNLIVIELQENLLLLNFVSFRYSRFHVQLIDYCCKQTYLLVKNISINLLLARSDRFLHTFL